MHRLRIIIPAYPFFNIYSYVADKITALGPLYIGTMASKLSGWEVEIIDENNCSSRFCPKDELGRPDHFALQEERPADIIAFYGSLSSTIPRVYELNKLYKKLGVFTIAGGKHVSSLPEEALENGIDVAVIGEAEYTIQELLPAWEKGAQFEAVAGVAIQKADTVHYTEPRELVQNLDELPFPDFSLLRYVNVRYYTFGRTRGCNSHCEFCSVKDRTRTMSPQRAFQLIVHLIETYGARHFFEVSDHFGADKEATIEFCNLLSKYLKKHKLRLNITVQMRLTDARHTDLLEALKQASITNIAIGYESPINEELLAMKKGYSSKDMVQWTKTYHRYGFKLHGMFIFGYPGKRGTIPLIDVNTRVKRYKGFIRKARIETIQLLHTIPLPGTELRQRLEEEGRIYPLNEIGWEYYDGQFPLHEPEADISSEELQRAVTKIMGRFYRFGNFMRLLLSILVHFPRIVGLSTLSLITFRVTYIKRAFRYWKARYFRDNMLRAGGFVIFQLWTKKFKEGKFMVRLKSAQKWLKERRVYNKQVRSLS